MILAKESSRTLAQHLQTATVGQTIKVVGDGADDRPVVIPTVAFRMLVDILSQMGQGNAVAVITSNAELTTQQAADILKVSRPYVVRLLENQAIPFSKVGTNRRIKFSDLLAYRRVTEVESAAALEELAAEAQELDMGYS